MEQQNQSIQVTVITVVYNAVDKIEETIRSVLLQTYESKEYIIIDGGSTDGTVEVIQRYEEQLAYFVSEPDNGIYDAMNKGIKRANGKWLNFMNAGDTFYDNHVLYRAFSVFAIQEFVDDVKVVYGNVVMKIGGQPEIIKDLSDVSRDMEPFSLNHQSTFTRTDFLREIGGYDTTYKIAADANSFYQVYKHGFQFRHIPVVISSYEAVEGVSAVNPMCMFREFSRITNRTMANLSWWKGFVKAFLMNLLNNFPAQIGNKMLSQYIKWRLR